MSNKKQLKVCLAMGGGVSLGSYSGAALTEALKLLVLYGQDYEGNSYESVEVDGMSGASAGSIALAIMMRCLIDYKTLLKNKLVQDKILVSIKELKDQGAVYQLNDTSSDIWNERLMWIINSSYKTVNNTHKMDQLVALEVAQIVQRIIWVDKLDVNLLFKPEMDSGDDFKRQFGLLSRESAISAAKEVRFPHLEEINVAENKRILSDRALMVFTMANLTPISYGEKRTDQTDVPILVKSLQNATTINNHNELRVFDFWFSKQRDPDKEDVRFITIPDNKGRKYTDKNTWAEILSSSIASGAFPFGFPPAIITRYKDEYDTGVWPNIELIKGNSGDIKSSPDYLNFSYVDGGTFNNEPIKEAFKLGAFIDFQKKDPKIREKEDRLILFVDPSVPAGNRANQLKSLDPLREVKGIDNRKKAESFKMIDMAMDMVSMVVSQGEINEEAKIQSFYNSSLLNKSLFEYFDNLDIFDVKQLLKTSLLKNVWSNLENGLKSRHISVGTRHGHRLIFSKYIKLCNAKGVETNCLDENSIQTMYNELSKFAMSGHPNSPEQVESALRQIVNDAGCNPEIEVRNFGMSVFLAISEMALNQYGKDSSAERAGIFPVNKDLKIESLPGSDLAAFAGFASQKAREVCFAKGRFDSIVCLESTDFRDYHHNKMLRENYKVKSYINNHKKIRTAFENHYNFFVKQLTPVKYVKDLNDNLRPNLVERIAFIFNNIISSVKDNMESGNFCAKLKTIIEVYKIWKNEDSIKALNKYFNADVLENLTQSKKNLAIKLRVKGKIDTVQFDNKISMKTVNQKENNEDFTYFKIYLVMVDHLSDLDKEYEYSDYCYLSTSKKTKKVLFEGLTDLGNISDSDRIDEILIGGFPKVTSSNLLAAFKVNFFKFKYGINPVFDIDKQGNITIDDLSEPLAKSIEPEWTPFV